MEYDAPLLSILGMLLSFALVYLTMPKMLDKLRRERITGKDVLKGEERMVPESGGIIVVLAVIISLSLVTYMFTTLEFGDTTRPRKAETQILMLSAVVTLLGVGFIGLVDDYLNIPQKYKIILPAFAGLPLAFAFLDRTEFYVPLIGFIRLGILYPLVLVPIGITAASNLTNMYAGLNGLEVGTGLITCSFTCFAAALIGRWEGVIILAPMIGALGAFLIYNRLPARVFPGDVGTMAIGASLAAASIVGRIKTIAVIALLPHIINFVMYTVKVRFFADHPEAKFASVREDGTLRAPEGAAYGSLYFATMHLFRRSEGWHVRLHWIFCMLSGILAVIVGILIYVE